MKDCKARPALHPGWSPPQHCLRAPLKLCQALCSLAGQSQAAHLQVEAGVLHHPLCQCGDVDPSIALPREEEIVLGVLREEPEEVLQCQVIVVSNLQGEGGMVRW